MGDDVIGRVRRHLTPALVFHTGVVARSAEGIYITGEDGVRYLDFASGLATTNLGHRPPRVVEAVRAQLDRMIHSGCIVYYDAVAELAERLARITPEGVDRFFFSNSGAEAVEGAIKLARHYTGRQGVVACIGAFHGRTTGAVALTTSSARYRRRYHPLLPSVFHVPYPYCYRCHMGRRSDDCSLECFGYLETTLRHLVTPEETACIIVEPVLGEGGYAPAPREYLQRLRRLCDEHGILLVIDEVQTGFGRTGRWFACEHYEVRPDIMTLGKGIASGFPLSAVAGRSEIMDAWPPGAHGTTFGGNPVSCAAASATIDTIERDGLLDNARRVGEAAMERLAAMKARHGCIGDVRGLGLMIGIEFVKDGRSPDRGLVERIIKESERKGLLLVECGTEKNVVRLMPPLIVTEEQLHRALDVIEDIIGG